MSQAIRRYAVVAAALLSLFIAVTLASTVALFLINGGPPPMEIVQVCVPEHSVMPEDAGRPDAEAEAMGCRR